MAIHTEYGLITLDVQLPSASGLESLSAIRSMSPHAIIAIISGHLPGDIPPAADGCADVVINKPVSVDTLSRLGSARKLLSQISGRLSIFRVWVNLD